MTVTTRKTVESASQVAPVPVTEPGVSYECDTCDSDITHTIRIKCATEGCEDIDLCVSCFCAGKEVNGHKAWHNYRVVEQHPYPIFTRDWGADEELLLIDGLIANGLGNWTAAAEHIGTRTPQEAEDHYYEVYLQSPNWPLPVTDQTFDIDAREFHSHKRARIAAMRQSALDLANAVSKPHTILTSAPTNHEIQGYMPGRLDFETEVENEAEDAVKDMDFGLVMEYGGADQPEPGPPPTPALDHEPGSSESRKDGDGGDAESNDTTLVGTLPDPIETADSTMLKLSMLGIYYEKLDRRQEAKSFVFDRGMLDYKKWQAHEKKRPKEDRELINKHKPFARLQTADDFESFVNGIMLENALRLRIKELQDFRKLGIRNMTDADKWVRENTLRYARPHGAAALRAINRASLPPANPTDSQPQGSSSFDQSSFSTDFSIAPPDENRPKLAHSRRRPAPLDLTNAESLHLLNDTEKVLCSQLRILPKPYLVVKEIFVSEFAKRGGNIKRRDARELVKIDVNKSSRIWDFLEETGLLTVRNSIPQAPL